MNSARQQDTRLIYRNLLYFFTPTKYKKVKKKSRSQIASTTRGQTAEARKITILQPVDQKPQLQKDREDEKAEGYVPDEGTRKNPRKTTK